MILKAETSESSQEFHQGMVNRMDLSYCKYGRYHVNASGRIDPKFQKEAAETVMNFLAKWDGRGTTTANSNTVASILLRLVKYLNTGNTEWLMDVANFAMIEHECPQVKGSHFKATDSHESPGLVGIGEKEMENL